jgi:aspartate-semialdehyde dehydrogenase
MAKQMWNVAVVGALGMVGTEMIKTLEQRGFPVGELRPLDREEFEGMPVTFHGASISARRADPDAFDGIDIALFSAGGEASLALAPKAVSKGAVVVDNSSAWRMDPKCPLVVPEVNREDLKWHEGIIANPNCSTIQMVVALKPLDDLARIKRVIVSTYQAASGAGQAGYTELQEQAKAILAGGVPVAETFPYVLAFNAIPHIDVFQDLDYTKEEWKMVLETQKIMGRESIGVSATCVRIPVYYGHSESINVQTERPIGVTEAREALQAAAGDEVIDDPARLEYPTPLPLAHTDAVYVGRIRQDNSVENGLNLWVVSDNIRKGAALNAVQIAEALVDLELVKIP